MMLQAKYFYFNELWWVTNCLTILFEFNKNFKNNFVFTAKRAKNLKKIWAASADLKI